LLEALPDEVAMDFDLKTSMEDAIRDRDATTAALLAALAAREARRRPVLITSFDPGALDIPREIAPGVPRGLLTWLDFPIGQAVGPPATSTCTCSASTGARSARTPSSPRRNAAHSTTSSISSTKPVGSSSPGAPDPSSPPS
jgi:glycerophosphoryl diester phosphodiesterase